MTATRSRTRLTTRTKTTRPATDRDTPCAAWCETRTGTPVVGIPVRYSLKVPQQPGAKYDPDNWHLSEAYTDTEGRYVIRGLPSGTLWMSLLSERNFGPKQEVDHALDGDWTHDFVIQGSLGFAGRVETPTDVAVEIWLDFREEMAGGAWGNIWKVRKATLPPGQRSFRFAAMRPGVYGLNVKAEGLEHKEVRLEVLESIEDYVVTLGTAFTARGKVTVPEGLDPEGTQLWLRPLSGDWQRSTACKPDGSFEVGEMTPGRYSIFLRNTTKTDDGAYVRSTERTLQVDIAGPDRPIDIAIARDQEVGLAVRLDGAPSARGRVTILGSPAAEDHGLDFRVGREADGTYVTRPAEISQRWPPVREATADGALRLDGMPIGTYRVRIEVPGYEIVEREVEITGATTIEVDLERRGGQIVRAKVPGRYYRISARRADDPDAAWREVLWRDDRVSISGRPTPGVFEAFLLPGTYEFRIASLEKAETLVGPVEVADREEPLVLRPELAPGFALQGRVVAGTGAGEIALLLHVFREGEDGSFERLEVKETAVREGRYRIAGLAPGRYRLSGSLEGRPVLAEVEVTDTDVEQHLRLGAAVGKDLPPETPKSSEPPGAAPPSPRATRQVARQTSRGCGIVPRDERGCDATGSRPAGRRVRQPAASRRERRHRSVRSRASRAGPRASATCSPCS